MKEKKNGTMNDNQENNSNREKVDNDLFLISEDSDDSESNQGK